MRLRLVTAFLAVGTAAALAACDRDPPAEEVLEQAEETLEDAPDVVPVPVPVPVDTSMLGDTLTGDTLMGDTMGAGTMQPGDTVTPRE